VEAERHYDFHLKKLKLGPHVKLIPPKEFEGTVFALILNFSSMAHLESLQSVLKKLVRHPSFEKILAISKK
jgi:hypothetical protein